MKTPKYEYGLYTWGGFYNNGNVAIHGHKDRGLMFFDTKKQRDEHLGVLQKACDSLGTSDACLVKKIWEGFSARDLPCIHRVIELDGKQYYSKCEWHWPEEIKVLLYHKEYKWYPGFNDYSAGYNVDYNKAVILEEWITGSFTIKNDEV